MIVAVSMFNWIDFSICFVISWLLFMQAHIWSLVPRPRPGPIATGKRQTIVGTIRSAGEQIPSPVDPDDRCIAWWAQEKDHSGMEYAAGAHDYTRHRPFFVERAGGDGTVWIEIENTLWTDMAATRQWATARDAAQAEHLSYTMNVARNGGRYRASSQWQWQPEYKVGEGLPVTIVRDGDEVVVSGDFELVDVPVAPTGGFRTAETAVPAYRLRSSNPPLGFGWLPRFLEYRPAPVLAKGRYPDVARAGSPYFWNRFGLFLVTLFLLYVFTMGVMFIIRLEIAGEI